MSSPSRKLLAVLLVGCARREAPSPTVTIVDAAPPVTIDAAPDATAARPWPDAIRGGQWAEAAAGIAALSPGEQQKPEVRLARARVASALGKHADAIAALDKIDDELPLLRDLVGKIRGQAMSEVGPFDRAAELLALRREPSAWVLSAEAWEKAGDTAKARVLWDRVIAFEKRSRAQEEKARFRRMTIVRLKEGDPAAAADARWLTIHALDDKVFSEAAELLEKLSPPKLLTSTELLTRGRMLAEAGRTDDALRTIERAPGRKPDVSAIDLCHARADAYWKSRSRYPEAAIAYRSCVAIGSPKAAEDALLAARSFLRAEREVDATTAFQNVIAKYPRTPQAEHAEFQLARDHALGGRWKDAAFAFDEYAKHWPTGKERREAERYRALAHLVSRNDKRARKLLEDLSGGAEDPVTAARWTNLAALAALRDGDKLHAIARWTDVAHTQPLSYPALVARARLNENGAPIPLAIEPAESGTIEPLAIELPQPVDMLHRIGFDAEAEEALHEREAAVIAKWPTRATEALCGAYALLDRAKRRYFVGLRVPGQALVTAPGGKNRSAWECVYARPFEGVVRSATTKNALPSDLVWSVMRQESAFDPDVVSPARAVGLMQLLPETARTTAQAASIEHDDTKLTVPSQNIQLGALYLHELIGKLDGSVPLAVAAYNAGPEAVGRWLAHAKSETLDVFVEAIPFVETRGYVGRVLGNLARYGYLDRGEAGVPTLTLELK